MTTLAEALKNSGDGRYQLRAEQLLKSMDKDTAATLREALHDPNVGTVVLSRAVKQSTGESLSATAINSYRAKHDITR